MSKCYTLLHHLSNLNYFYLFYRNESSNQAVYFFNQNQLLKLPPHKAVNLIMQELTLMYNMTKMLTNTLQEISAMFQEYAESKSLPLNSISSQRNQNSSFSHLYEENKNSGQPKFKRDSSGSYFKQSAFTPKLTKASEVNFKKPGFQPKLSKVSESVKSSNLSYKQRTDALRKLGKKSEIEMGPVLNADEEAEDGPKTTAFFLFLQQKTESIRKDHPELQIKEITKILGEVWKNMARDERRSYEVQNKDRKQDFDKNFRKYLQEMNRLQKSGLQGHQKIE